MLAKEKDPRGSETPNLRHTGQDRLVLRPALISSNALTLFEGECAGVSRSSVDGTRAARWVGRRWSEGVGAIKGTDSNAARVDAGGAGGYGRAGSSEG